MVTKKPKGLGRGLEALLGPDRQVRHVRRYVDRPPRDCLHRSCSADMVPGVYQPRTRMDEGALYELAESIKAQGIMQPILVRRLGGRAPTRASTKSSPASAASARPGWRAWTACRCWCATCPTKPRRRCR